MRKLLIACSVCVLLVGSAIAQKSSQWNEWSKKDTDKMLNDSVWAQSQIKGEAPPDASATVNAGRSQQSNSNPGGVKPSTEFYFRVRFISAKPIREAFARRILLSQTDPTTELIGQLQAAIDQNFGNYIVVGVNADGQDARTVGRILHALGQLTTAVLSEKAYLERKDGKRLQLIEYRPPIADNMGGKFIFTRTLDDKPFLSADSDSVRFVLNMTGDLKLNMKFKVASMMYGGNLEY
jgi:hypothetical protein